MKNNECFEFQRSSPNSCGEYYDKANLIWEGLTTIIIQYHDGFKNLQAKLIRTPHPGGPSNDKRGYQALGLPKTRISRTEICGNNFRIARTPTLTLILFQILTNPNLNPN